jgi:hypothetical protein
MNPIEMLEYLKTAASATFAQTLHLVVTLATAIAIVIMAIVEILEFAARLIMFPFTFITIAFVAAILAPFDVEIPVEF